MKIWVSVFLGLTIFGLSSFACAHEQRVVAGQFDFVVGFAEEPAFSGAMNGVDLRVSTAGGFSKPVEGLEDTLKVTVTTANQSREFSFRTKYKEPGRYIAYFFPTQPGRYSLRIQGIIKGVNVDETFVSGKKFHDIEDVENLKFP